MTQTAAKSPGVHCSGGTIFDAIAMQAGADSYNEPFDNKDDSHRHCDSTPIVTGLEAIRETLGSIVAR